MALFRARSSEVNMALGNKCHNIIGILVVCVIAQIPAATAQVQDSFSLEPTTGEPPTSVLNKGDLYGAAVAISAERAIIGADLTNGSEGAAYIFDLTASPEPIYLQKIIEDSPVAFNEFASAVAIDSTLTAIGARKANGKRGRVYLYDSDQNLDGTLELSDGVQNIDNFGFSVAVDEGRIVVGAPGRDRVGKAYFYPTRRDSPTELSPEPLPRSELFFGTSVAVSRMPGANEMSTRIAVGAPGPKVDANNSETAIPGAVYIYDNTGVQLFRLTAGENSDSFGFSVDISGDIVAVGAPEANTQDIQDNGAVNSGAVYLYDLSTCNIGATSCPHIGRIVSEDIMSLDLFGSSVSLSGETLAVGAPIARHDPGLDPGGGAAYVFDIGAVGIDGFGKQIAKLVSSETKFQDAFGISVDISEDFVLVGASQTDGACAGGNESTAKCNSGSAYVFEVPPLPTEPPPSPQLQAGDADQDLDFDQLDLVKVQIAAKYLTGQAATWGEGDWNGAPGGEPSDPPTGDGLFNQFDIIAANLAGTYLQGPYAAITDHGSAGDGQTSLVYDRTTGNLSIDAPAGIELTSVNITSQSGRFRGDSPAVLDGAFDNFANDNIFKATFGGSFGSISFGNVLEPRIERSALVNDLSAIGSLAGGGDLGDVDLVYVPEPSSLVMLVVAFILGVSNCLGRLRTKRISSVVIITYGVFSIPSVSFGVTIEGTELESLSADLIAKLSYDGKCIGEGSCGRIDRDDDRFSRFFEANSWKLRIDPTNLLEAKISIRISDGDRARLNGVRYLGGFEQAAPPTLVEDPASNTAVLNVHARVINEDDGPVSENVDFVELVFADSVAYRHPSETSFEVFAETDTDFLRVRTEQGQEGNIFNSDGILRINPHTVSIPFLPNEPGQPPIQGGGPEDSRLAFVYRRVDGSVRIDVPDNARLNAINITSENGIFTGQRPDGLDGPFDVFEEDTVFKSVFGGEFGDLDFGLIATPNLTEDELLDDLLFRATLAGDPPGRTGPFVLGYVANPEPSSIVLLLLGSVLLLHRTSRTRR